MMSQDEVVLRVTDVLLRYGYSYNERVVNAFDGRYVWISPERSGWDMKIEPAGKVCVWYFENGDEYAERYSYEDLLDMLPGALECELIDQYDRSEKQELRKMRKEYV